MPTNCPKGKVVNPATGRCVNKDSPVLKKSLNPLKKQKIINIVSPKSPRSPRGPSVPSSKVFVKCGVNKVINPYTNKCVDLFKNKDVIALRNKGWKFPWDVPSVPSVPSVPTIKKVPINDPKNKTDPGVKVLVPPDSQDTIKLVYCGKGKVINPQTGRCILLSGPIGKKLMSKPYVIVNPPSKPQKAPLFIPEGPKPKPVKGPKGPKEDRVPKVPKIPFPKMKPEKIRTALDTDGDNYVSIREYLDVAESLGPNEKGKGPNFAFYNQRDLGIIFILTLIKELKGPIHHIGCIPLFHLCVYKNASGTYYTMENVRITKELSCSRTSDFYQGSKMNTYASIVMIYAPQQYDISDENMQILTPPNLSQLIRKCESDNKYMVVCDLTLLPTDNFMETSHANVLIFDTKRKTIERFDPHGGSEYSDVKLAYDTDGKSTGRRDFFGKNRFGLDKPYKIKSDALFNQVKIDSALKKHLRDVLPGYTYYGTNDTTPYLGPQIKTDEFAGLCVTWSCMYMLLRLLNPDLSPADVTVKMIDGSPSQLRNRILRFQKFIIRTLQKTRKDVRYEFN